MVRCNCMPHKTQISLSITVSAHIVNVLNWVATFTKLADTVVTQKFPFYLLKLNSLIAN